MFEESLKSGEEEFGERNSEIGMLGEYLGELSNVDWMIIRLEREQGVEEGYQTRKIKKVLDNWQGKAGEVSLSIGPLSGTM